MVDGIAVAAHESKICVNDPLCPSVLASLVCLHFDMTYREERPRLLVKRPHVMQAIQTFHIPEK